MTRRKPADVDFGSWVESLINEAVGRGEFDDLPGAGKPLPGLSGPPQEHWWLKEYLRREELSTEALLPTPFRLRKEVERLPGAVRGLAAEQQVRDIVADLNDRIEDWFRTGSGPQVPLRFVDGDAVVDQWRRDRAEAARAAREREEPPAPEPRRRWWRRGRPA